MKSIPWNSFDAFATIRGQVGACLAVLLVVSASAGAAPATTDPMSLGQRLDVLSEQMQADADLARQVDAVLATARHILEKPIIKRVHSYQQLVRTDGTTGRRELGHARPAGLDDPLKRYPFALATSDQETANLIYAELPLLAAAYRLSDEPAFLDYIVRQFQEVATWSPLQRPGWSIPYVDRLPEGGDGVWLATGVGIRAIVMTRSILPADSLPTELEAELDALLDLEIQYIMDDWTAERPWYVKSQAVQSNQWMVPLEGLILATCALGTDQYGEEYEFGVENLRKTLDSLGEEGAMSEGFTYAIGLTMQSLQSIGLYMAMNGDPQVSEHPFMERFGLWLTQHYQPGQYFVNYFDSYGLTRGVYDRGTNDRIASLAVLSGDPYLYWLLRTQHQQMPHSVFGLLAMGTLTQHETLAEPPTHSQWQRSRSFIWRSSWDDDATGLWARGRDPMDSHDHHDAGHVNFIVDGKAALIESGTVGYRNPRLADDYQSVRGHNVLQIGDELRTERETDVPIDVLRVDSDGGELVVTPTAGYPALAQWQRSVAWTPRTVAIEDSVQTLPDEPQPLLLRFHLATQEAGDIQTLSDADQHAYEIRIPAGQLTFPGWTGTPQPHWDVPDEDIIDTPAMRIRIESPDPIRVELADHVNHTMRFRAQHLEHQVVLIESDGPAEQVTTRFHLEVLEEGQ